MPTALHIGPDDRKDLSAAVKSSRKLLNKRAVAASAVPAPSLD
jgi:hypothetical protein